MKSDVNGIFDDLEGNLARFQKVRRLKDDSEAYILKALQWLIAHQHSEGYWGDESTLDTLTSLQALAAWGINSEKWASFPKSAENGIEKAFSWCSEKGTTIWAGNLWEAALAVRI